MATYYPTVSKHFVGAERHMAAFWSRGINKDPDSGEHPLAHAIARLLILLQLLLEQGAG